MATDVGVVSSLWRYAVKSMRGERCDVLALGARGVEGDRLFAVRDANGKLGSGKSTRRFRRIDGLFRFGATLERETPVVEFPDGGRMRADDPAIHDALSAALSQPVTLVREGGVSHLDSGPVHVVTEASLGALGAELGGPAVDARRFRPNLVLGGALEPFAEDGWPGRELLVGEARLRFRAATERCVMVGFAQAELPEDPRVLRALATRRAARFGVYAEVVSPGRVRIGDRAGLA